MTRRGSHSETPEPEVTGLTGQNEESPSVDSSNEYPAYEQHQGADSAIADTPATSHPGRFSYPKARRHGASEPSIIRSLCQVNKELWLVLSMLALAFALNYLVTGHRMILGFYTFPTLFAAYFYGRRHATLTALASVFLVGLLARINPNILAGGREAGPLLGRWYDIMAWGGVLVVTAYTMGTLHEHHQARIRELKHTYRGLLLILRHFISKDKYTENHSYRVSVYASKIATYMGLSDDQVEDVRAASLIHDIGKLKTSRALLYRAANLARQEYEEMKRHVDKGAAMLEPVGGPLHRIIPIVLAHHDKFDGTGYHPKGGQDIPLEARIIAVADWYDSLTSDRPYRRAMSPFDAKETIFKASGTEFDPDVVDAFIQAFRENEMEVPELVL
jgi:putative nucleotidyltransferase with HDIG domain